MTAFELRTEECECYGGPLHRRFIVVTQEGAVVHSCCEWVHSLLQRLSRPMRVPITPRSMWLNVDDFLAERGVTITPPPPEWLEAVGRE